MKRILLTTVSLGVLGLVSPALAADLPVIRRRRHSRRRSMTGPVSTSAGSAAAATATTTSTMRLGRAGFANFTVNYSSQGGLAGGEVGYNVQSGRYLFGVEGDAFWSNIKGNDNVCARLERCDQPALGRHACGREAASPSIACCCSSPAAGPMAICDHTNTDPVIRRRSVHRPPERPDRRRRHRLCDHQQPDRQDSNIATTILVRTTAPADRSRRTASSPTPSTIPIPS